MPTPSQQITRLAILCAGAFAVLNFAFFFLSASYFDSHHDMLVGAGGVAAAYTPEQMTHVRITFAVFSGVVAAFGFAAGLQPRVVGHVIPVLFGVFDLIASVVAFARHAPAVLPMTLLVAGLLLPVLAWFSYRGSRAAWAFLVAMCGVFAIVELFGAPKLRGALDVGLWTTMILPGLKAVGCVALFSLRDDYVERSAV